MPFLPVSRADLESRGCSLPDFVLVTGDAYADHPAFAAALLGRLLEAEGYSVALLARPDPDDVEAFRLAGRPRLAFLVGSGALDSMVSSYTAARRPRSGDDYAPGGRAEVCLRGDGTLGPGKAGRGNARPDRAVLVYSAKCREAYKGVPVVIGGIEASLRRFAHYDYWSDSMRRSVLLDSKADILVHGMGETALLEIARRLAAGEPPSAIRGVRGTSWWVPSTDVAPPGAAELPPWSAVSAQGDRGDQAYAESFSMQHLNADPFSGLPMVEDTDGRRVVHEPAAYPLSPEILDRLHEAPYERAAHPAYEGFGGIPALEEVRFSLASSRGCFGSCSFCSLAFHQGRIVQPRTAGSLEREARTITALPGFKGYIHDVGGPTANFRAPACSRQETLGACPDRRCLAPEACPSLRVDHSDYLAVLRRLRALPGVRKVFVRSGIRFDYLAMDPDEEFFRELVRHHVSGQLKVAPEHVSDRMLRLMGKPSHEVYKVFAEKFRNLSREAGLRQYLLPYYISAHPGSTLADALELAENLRDSGFIPDQVQDFYPTPGTRSTVMFRTGRDPLTGEAVHVARGTRERALQRALIQHRNPENRMLVLEALEKLNRMDLVGRGPKCLVDRCRRSANGRSEIPDPR
ncbi:MAG TPA: YgiQ family radical SAM protein [Magnetospirillaceae bacterium]|nr:YgiQ family radical SAM protein [Magnetospirillaceae bacterium]